MGELNSLTAYRGGHGIQKSQAWLCCGPLIFRALDYGVTLYGQPSGYWQGHYDLAREASPVLLWCLRLHPLAFVTAALGLSLIFSLFILCWPIKPARFVAAVLTFGHIYGMATWVLPTGALGAVVCVLVLYGAGLLLNATWGKQEESPYRDLSAAAS